MRLSYYKHDVWIEIIKSWLRNNDQKAFDNYNGISFNVFISPLILVGTIIRTTYVPKNYNNYANNLYYYSQVHRVQNNKLETALALQTYVKSKLILKLPLN